MTRVFCALALLLLLPASLGSSCETPTPVPPNPPPATGGQPDATGGAPGTGGWINPFTGGYGTGGAPPTDPVLAFCWRLHDLGCPEGSNVDQCITETRNLLALGPRVSLDLACVINASTQPAVRACESVVCGGVL